MTTETQTTLKTQHIIFINEMAAHGIQRRAYMAAHPGCSAQAADRGAHRLMEKPEIRSAIETAGERLMMEEYEIQKDELQRRLHRLETHEDMIMKVLGADFQKRVCGEGGVVLSKTEDHSLLLRAMRFDRVLAKDRAELLKEMRSLRGMTASPDEPNPTSGPSEGYTIEEYCSIDDLTEEEKKLLEESRAEPTVNPEPDKTEETTQKSSKEPDKTGQTGHFSEKPFEMPVAGSEVTFGRNSIYASLPAEERTEMDALRRRYYEAKAATDKLLYGV